MTRGNVLVVEDDDTIRRLLMDVLRESASFDVDGARDGRDALHQISTRPYAVVVLDVMMPYMSGIDFLDSLQALLNDPSLKSIEQPPAVLVITSAPQEVIPAKEIRDRFPTLVHEVMRKPVDVTALAKRVETLL
ncbi:MAG TPA: response regulator [Thermoanaerobaculia bacterium]|nr:response regulator [Thermoanaerobaculia bacterium]